MSVAVLYKHAAWLAACLAGYTGTCWLCVPASDQLTMLIVSCWVVHYLAH